MADREVQLTDSAGDNLYPVTSGSAVRMTGNKTLDQAFNDKVDALQTAVNNKILELDEWKNGFSFYAEFNKERTFNVNTIPMDFSFNLHELGMRVGEYKVVKISTMVTNSHSKALQYMPRVIFEAAASTKYLVLKGDFLSFTGNSTFTTNPDTVTQFYIETNDIIEPGKIYNGSSDYPLILKANTSSADNMMLILVRIA